jgi:hypothetical protein
LSSPWRSGLSIILSRSCSSFCPPRPRSSARRWVSITGRRRDRGRHRRPPPVMTVGLALALHALPARAFSVAR